MNTRILKAGILIFLMGSLPIFAQKTSDKEQTITVKSFIACSSCVNRIEKELPFMAKGIKEVKADSEKNEIYVTYLTGKTTPENIRQGIAALGYDADEVKANEKAFSKLPKHCQQNILLEKSEKTPSKTTCH